MILITRPQLEAEELKAKLLENKIYAHCDPYIFHYDALGPINKNVDQILFVCYWYWPLFDRKELLSKIILMM